MTRYPVASNIGRVIFFYSGKQATPGTLNEVVNGISGKDEVIKFMQDLPDNVTIEDILYRLYVRARIDEGLTELDAGKGLAHSEAMEHINKWLTS